MEELREILRRQISIEYELKQNEIERERLALNKERLEFERDRLSMDAEELRAGRRKLWSNWIDEMEMLGAP